MSGILTQLKRVAVDLNELKAPWALVGALAASVHAEPRTTRDIDVAVAISTAELAELEKKLLLRGYKAGEILMHALPTHRLGIRMQVPSTDVTGVALDILTASTGIEGEVVAAALQLEVFPALFVPVATLGHVLAMKVLSQNDSDRIRDRADVQQLLIRATDADLEVTKIALQLIEQRGFSRGKNLLQEFEGDLLRYRKRD